MLKEKIEGTVESRGRSRGGRRGLEPPSDFQDKGCKFFLDSFLQVFCWLQFTRRCSLITNHKAFRANIQRYMCSKLLQ